MVLALGRSAAFLENDMGPKEPGGVASRIASASEADNLWQRMDKPAMGRKFAREKFVSLVGH
jgi:hypothetical protein